TPVRSVSGPAGDGVLAVPRDAPLRPGGGRGGGEEPAQGAAPGPAAAALWRGAAAGGFGRLLAVPVRFPAGPVRSAGRGAVPRGRAGEPGAPEPVDRPDRHAGAALRALQRGLAGAAHGR